MSYFGPIIQSSSGITASSSTFAQLQAGGPSAHMERLITANGTASVAPTSAATATATGGGSTGGNLAAGTYYFVFTEGNGWGETLISPEGSQLTISAGNIPQFTFPSLKTGNLYRNLYLGVQGGSSGGPYFLYKTGITSTTFSASAAVGTNSQSLVQPPATSTTGLTSTNATTGVTGNRRLTNLRAASNNRLQQAYDNYVQAVNDFLRGEPSDYQMVMQLQRDFHCMVGFLDTMCGEIGVLLDANSGTIHVSSNAIGNATQKRQWP